MGYSKYQNPNPKNENKAGKNSDKLKLLDEILNVNDKNIKKFLNYAEEFANKNLKYISFTKIRKFYDYLNEISPEDEDWIIKFAHLKPMVAYHYGKEKRNQGLFELKKLIDAVFDKIYNENDENKRKEMFKHFKKFFEAIIAYKRFYEGK
ncbi:type III-A CRISPR-associated protein Csm2 [Methanotorris igneus]|uniref:CRISPR system Cms protein Csm2 n=1 Tax=Methanotorris igneus (strain DSM 5666 / JCM 11834 / Kol 5) TaxID=880724 RepID=F6BEA8_METIK|nr:type III-A CRISPR-associated protein Csm2 [Methanotorris igneus]AEF96785.1 CRISPR-associated protein TM1810 domain protein [Methanotorris igneus Kol 5]